MTTALLLTAAELHSLTGYVHRDAQCRRLRELGIPFKESGRQIIVSRHHVLAWLEGRPMREQRGPNMGAIA